MNLTTISRERLVKPEGGSLGETSIDGDEFVKTYGGGLERGYEKLRLEYEFLRELPPEVAAHFARVTGFHYDESASWAELRLERIRHPAFAKAILRRVITPARTSELLSMILPFLISDLYPIRGGEISGAALYKEFHGDRMLRSLDLLTAHPELRKLATAPTWVVNGITCTSVGGVLEWVNSHASEFFQDSHRLVAGHGDAHLDNMMITEVGAPDFLLIDPRGESLLPPHYDFAKMLKSLRTGYDLVHYGLYGIDVRYTSSAPTISLRISGSYADYYGAGMDVLISLLPSFCQAEGVSESVFVRVVALAEIAHVISLSSYHANRPGGCDVKRVSAYLAIAALLAHELIMKVPDLARPLPIWDKGTECR
ncbi:phosphotransferase [Streptomyces sp. NPDC051639]|uniref:phosphotransferase n=1 Tax=unclassified Streptomyces TaxID=2593676 RepID=UPI002E315B72|nr:phosphotransferase [Streptomyces sp. NBC_01717]